MQSKQIAKQIIGLLIIAVLFPACGAIFRGTNQDLQISTVPPGATARIQEKECVTPCTLHVSRKTKTVKIEKNGRTNEYDIEQQASVGTIIVDAILGGGIGLVLDYALGGTITLSPVEVDLTSSPTASSTSNDDSSSAAPSAVIESDVDDVSSAKKAKIKTRSYAIVIGIEQYRQGLPPANFAAHDAQKMTEYLTKVLGYPEESVVTLLNDRASNVDLAKYFEKWLPNNVEPGGTVFIYYSGHGAPNPKTGDAYLVPYDGDPSFIDETGYSLKRMYAALGKLPAKEVIVALDSCFSGAGGRSVLAKGSRPLVMNMQTVFVLSRNMTVLSAAAGDQISSTYDEKGHGLFTYFMLKGIKNEDVVKPDGSIAISDLFGYIKPQVERIARKQYNNEQSPQLIEAKKK